MGSPNPKSAPRIPLSVTALSVPSGGCCFPASPLDGPSPLPLPPGTGAEAVREGPAHSKGPSVSQLGVEATEAGQAWRGHSVPGEPGPHPALRQGAHSGPPAPPPSSHPDPARRGDMLGSWGRGRGGKDPAQSPKAPLFPSPTSTWADAPPSPLPQPRLACPFPGPRPWAPFSSHISTLSHISPPRPGQELQRSPQPRFFPHKWELVVPVPHLDASNKMPTSRFKFLRIL